MGEHFSSPDLKRIAFPDLKHLAFQFLLLVFLLRSKPSYQNNFLKRISFLHPGRERAATFIHETQKKDFFYGPSVTGR